MTEQRDTQQHDTTTPAENAGRDSIVPPYARGAATAAAETAAPAQAGETTAEQRQHDHAAEESPAPTAPAFSGNTPPYANASGYPSIPGWLRDPIIQCLIVTGILSAIFLAVPALDTWFTGLFYEEGQGFPVARLGFFWGIRELHSLMTWAIAIIAGFPILWKFVQPLRPSLIPPRASLLILGTLAIGPGLIINGLFKSNWGRPRPYSVDLFGGDHPFVGVWEITDYCNRNCSFISGESSSAIWLITAAVLVPPVWRPLAIRILVGLGIIFALNRIAFGGHFLSDVLLAWFITLAIIAFAWRILYVNPPRWLTDEALEARGTRNALWVHRLFRRKRKESLPKEPNAG